ncbi:MBL fold metallo-hydrolase [Frondihabitans sp. VKM Ac-2883]|uniref:MBL fold metallo-hydrolase n=1 Tax=Frondihabitans sp. VKM Ac-2883 TaxID=2783823 RepID=UPI00351C9F04
MLVATSRRDSTTTTVVVGSNGRDCLLIDPAWEVDELASIADALASRGLTVTAGFSTHAHFDHLLWHPGFGNAPRWASAETARRARDDRPAILAELGAWPAELLPLVGAVTATPGDRLPWRGVDVQLIEHDAHVPGHTAVWVPSRGILVAGDMLSDIEPPLPFEPDSPISPAADPLATYAAGLTALEPFARRAAIVIPGHGTPGKDPTARLTRDRHHIEALRSGRDPHDDRRPPAPATSSPA